MKILATFIIILLLLSSQLSPVLAWQGGKPITPYGDFCRRCGQYGTCRSMMSHEDSRKAMIEYYHRKGLDVEIESIDGRFIKASVKDKRGVVDVIIFDRQTGRVRSIY